MSRLVRYASLLTLALAASLAGSYHASADGFDETKLKTIPLIEIIRIAASPYQDGGPKSAADLAPQIRTLVRLAMLDANLISTDGQPTTYYGDPALFSKIVAALESAGLARQAAAFRAAIPGVKPTFDAVSPTAGRLPRMLTLTLGDAFGTKASFAEAILAYVRDHSIVAAWCEAARRQISDEDRLYALEVMLARIPLNAVMKTMETWPEPYRRIQLASIFEGQLSNGGIEQYFWNSTGALAPATVAALRAIGLPGQAAAIVKGMDVFAQPYPIDTNVRQRVLRDDPGGADIGRKLGALTVEADVDGIPPAVAAYARREGILPH